MATHTLGHAKKNRKWLPLSWSHGSWIYNYLCNQCISPLKLWVRTPLRRGVLDTTLCDKVCQWHVTGRWFSPVTSTNKTDRYDITDNIVESGVKHDDPSPKKIGWYGYWNHMCFWPYSSSHIYQKYVLFAFDLSFNPYIM